MNDCFLQIDPETTKMVRDLAYELDREVDELDSEALEYALIFGPKSWHMARAYKEFLNDIINP